MEELECICQVSRIPAPFTESLNLLNLFIKTPSISAKVRACSSLIEKLK